VAGVHVRRTRVLKWQEPLFNKAVCVLATARPWAWARGVAVGHHGLQSWPVVRIEAGLSTPAASCQSTGGARGSSATLIAVRILDRAELQCQRFEPTLLIR